MNSLKEAVEYWNRKLLPPECLPRPEATPEECAELRVLCYRPGQRVRFYAFEAEIASDPFPSRYGASVRVRDPRDPAMVVEAGIDHGVLELLERKRA